MNKKEKELIENYFSLLINEQLVQLSNKETTEEDGQQTLVPLTPDQINKKSIDIANKFINNIFASVKTSLGTQYYDETEDKLVKDVKIKNLLTKDFQTFINKVINTATKQSSGQEQPGVGVNKTNA